MRSKNVSMMVEGALMVAIAFGLHFIKLFHAPYGGSVTVGGMVPLLLFAVRHGAGPGIMAGAAYGFLDLVVNPYVVHPAQLLLDYPIAYGALGLCGLFPDNVAIGAFVGISGRFVASFLSGVIFFAAYATGNVWTYSALYNAGYLVPECIISIILLLALQRTGLGSTRRY